MVDFGKVDLRLAWTDEPPPWGGAVLMPCPRKDKHRKEDRTSSLAVYPQSLHCFACNFHVSRRRIYAALALVLGWWDGVSSDDGHWQKARDIIERYTTDHLDAYREQGKDKAMKEPMDRRIALEYATTLWKYRQHRVGWLTDRGLTPEAIKYARIGHNGAWFTIPVFDQDDNLLTIRYRRDDAYSDYDDDTGKDTRPKYKGTKGRNGTFLYGLDNLDDLDTIYAVEGELDAVRLHQENLSAVSTTNGAGQSHHIPALLKQAGISPKHLLILTDQDPAGDAAAVLLSQTCEELGIDWLRGVWYNGKDITEYLRHGGKLEEIEYGKYWTNLPTRRVPTGGGGGGDTPGPKHVGRSGSSEDFSICMDSFRQDLRW